MSSTNTGAPDIAHAKAWLEDAAAKLRRWAREIEDASARENEGEHPVDRLRDLAATIADVAERAPLPVANGAILVMTGSALAAWSEAQQLITRASEWAQGADIPFELTQDDTGLRIVARRREQVAEMELSLHRGLAHLATVNQRHDGPVTVTRDSEGSFYWRHTQSGYHGGLIFHANYADTGRERLPVGTWSIHT
jgi:hypothetical protein